MMTKYLDELSERGENRFENLMGQVKEVFGSEFNDNNVKTNEKYFTAVSTFTKYLSEYEGINKISNVESKHIFNFVEKMQDLGMSDSTLKGYMAGIRDFFDMGKQMWDKCKTVVPDNDRLGLEQRINGNVERAWTKEEIQEAKTIALEQDRLDVYHAINIAENFGTRIDGTCSLTTLQIDKALETEELHVKEKGGHERDIKVTPEGREALLEAKEWGETRYISRDRIFCDTNDIRGVKQAIQDWIYNHRNEFQNAERIPHWVARENFAETGQVTKADLTLHGIRHTWAEQKYQEYIDKGYNEKKALKEVSELLGHNREEVTKVYLAKS